MTHLAIPNGAFSPAEAELAFIADSGTARLDDSTPVGLLVIAMDCRLAVVVIAMATRFDVDHWWTP